MSAHRPLAAVLAALLALGIAACAPASDPSPEGSTDPTATAPGAEAELPDDAPGRQAAWVLSQLEDDAAAGTGDITNRFAQSFLDEVSAAELAGVLAQLRDAGPWTLSSVQSGPANLAARIAGPSGELDMQLVLDGDERITGLLFTPAPPPREPAASWSELSAEVEALAGSSALFVARVEDGTCVPLEGSPTGSAPDDALPIGSMIKLYVLGAVVDAVERGDLAWDDEVTVTDELRSLPSGRLQEARAGTTVSVLEAARAMIAISDNTATDLLIDAVGRERVEQALADLGHGAPELNVPLASTRELFLLGWGRSAQAREEWRDADAKGRRAILERLAGSELDVNLEQIPQLAVWPFGIDWFATGADLCAAHVALAARSGTPAGEQVREILSANPGMAVPAGYDYLAFKGGSSTGTMGGSWFAERADGEAVVVVLQTATEDPGLATHPETMVGIARDALRLAAEAP